MHSQSDWEFSFYTIFSRLFCYCSIHKEKPRKIEEPTAPVGSVYQKIRPQAEINIEKRDKFWEKTQVCEPVTELLCDLSKSRCPKSSRVQATRALDCATFLTVWVVSQTTQTQNVWSVE